MTGRSPAYKLGFHLGGIRNFGGVGPTNEILDVEVFLDDMSVLKGYFPQTDSNSMMSKRAYRADYLSVDVHDGDKHIIKAVTKRGTSQITKTNEVTRSVWIHVNYHRYPVTDNPDSEQGLVFDFNDVPQTYR